MKNIIFSAIIIAMLLISCNQKNKVQSDDTALYSCPMDPEVTGKKGAECSKCGMELTEPVMETKQIDTTSPAMKTPDTMAIKNVQASFSISKIIDNYLKIKNALIEEDSKNTAVNSENLVAEIKKSNIEKLSEKDKKAFNDFKTNAQNHTAHIIKNTDNIEHQREHFALLSTNMNELIAVFGSKKKLFQDFCPMAENGKGAIWISEIKEIRNPYFGEQMLACGSIKKEY